MREDSHSTGLAVLADPFVAKSARAGAELPKLINGTEA